MKDLKFYRRITKIGSGKGFSIPKEMHEFLDEKALYELQITKIE